MVWYCYRKINFSPEKEVRDVNLMPWKQAFFSFLTYGFIFRSIEGEMKISVLVANERSKEEKMRYFSYVKAILLLIYVSLPSSAIQCYCKYFCLSSVRRWMEVVKNGLQRGKSSVSNFFPGTQCNALCRKCSKRINFCNVLYFDLYWLLFFDNCLYVPFLQIRSSTWIRNLWSRGVSICQWNYRRNILVSWN